MHSQAGDGRVVVDDRFDDEGHSGAALDRPKLNRLLGVVQSGGVDRVVYPLDRLSHSLRHFVDLSEGRHLPRDHWYRRERTLGCKSETQYTDLATVGRSKLYCASPLSSDRVQGAEHKRRVPSRHQIEC